MSSVAGEASESAILLDIFTTVSVQLNVIHYSLEIEYIKSIIKNPSQANSILAQITWLVCFQKEQTS